MDRRSVIGLGALGLAQIPLRASAEAIAPAPETISLWPSVPPGGDGARLTLATVAPGTALSAPGGRTLVGIASPSLTVYRAPNPDGSAVLVIPGGGYSREAFDFEGVEPALRLNEAGVTAFVLLYRLPGEGWQNRADVPLQDAQRAMRLIRGHGVRDYGIDPARVGVLGFSAGGHLAASLATRFAATVYPPSDVIDNYDPRPSFAALLYPVITMLPPYAHESSCTHLLGPLASNALRAAYSAELLVDVATPPCFIVAAEDDPDVPVHNAIAMDASLRDAKVASEMHLFERGGHGFGLGGAFPAGAWPELFVRWGVARGYFRSAAAKL
jgi:acetyl esterase/lipase